ncbi:MAG: hypothetical protein GY811_24300 [Myxococcales bacterium]|nr:hypothetical protein [Myxococcales bacterium]
MPKFQLSIIPLVVHLVVPAGCSDKSANSSADEKEVDKTVVKAKAPSDPHEATKPLAKKVRPQHFKYLSASANALLFNDLKSARESLRWLNNQEGQDPPVKTWKSHEDKLRNVIAAMDRSSRAPTNASRSLESS